MAGTTPGLHLDAVTLLAAVSLCGFVTSAVAAAASRGAPAQAPALRWWSGAMAAGGLAFLFFAMRGAWPPVLTFYLANMLALVAPACGVLAMRALGAGTPRRLDVLVVLLLGWSVLLLGRPPGPADRVVYVGLNACVALLLGAMAVAALSPGGRGRCGAAWLAAAAAGLPAVGFAARSASAVAGPLHPIGQSDVGVLVVLLLASVFVTGGNLALFLMVGEAQRREWRERARRDHVTGLYNRAALADLVAELERRGDGMPLGVLMLDLDRFKRVNDTHGHRAGDVTLAHAARRIAGLVRPTDIVARYGGEEFCVLLPRCVPSQAADVARRIVEDARRQQVRVDAGVVVSYTLSAGLATATRRGAAGRWIEGLVDRADGALFRAKAEGRDQLWLDSGDVGGPGGGAS